MGAIRDKRYFRLRRFWLRLMDAVLLNGAVARWSYRLGLHGKLRIAEHTLELANGKSLPAPLRIAFVSDLHAGPQTHAGLFAKMADELIRLQPDVILLGGDYVSSRGSFVDVLIAQLGRLHPPLGVHAVLGNHDWWTDEQHIVSSLRQAGVNVLINCNCALPGPFTDVSICGLDDPWTGNADPARTFSGAGAIRILLTHSPDGLLLLDGQQFDLAFAGHTHGGQVAFRSGAQILTAGGPLSRKYGRGKFQIENSGTLIVSLGIGCSNFPVRINADSELVLCTVRSASTP
ncbi:MAG TPA: metallophosphoesterase [Steroidobacteraceae bacterium]|jgi:hypothetical protein|nr:metallophosphoesterase [Steroidobacteraceae bacterium]